MHRTSKGFRSIRWRMVSIYIMLTIVGFGVVLFSVSRIVENYLVEQRVGEQQELADALSLQMAPYAKSFQANALYRLAAESAQKLGGRVLVLDNNGVIQVDSYSGLNGRSAAYPEAATVLWGASYSAHGLYKLTDLDLSDDNIIIALKNKIFPPKSRVVYYASAMVDGGQRLGCVMMSVSIQDVFDRLSSIRGQVTLVMLGVMLAVAVTSFFTAHQLTQPIVEMTSVIRRIGRGELNLRVRVDSSSSELEELGKTFNDMTTRLENTDRFRSEFVSNASHEIKTPLATMKILIESLVYQEKLDEKVTREFLGDINSEIDRLSLVVSDLLRMVQIDRDQAELKKERTDLEQLCHAAVKRLAPIAAKKNITLDTRLESVSASVDPVKLDQVVFNLVDNAIKYTDPGGTVTTVLKSEPQGARLAVSDTGIGIPQKDIEHIFERFYRVDKARSRATGGTGLGLSIVEKIVKLHGGTITVQSEEGKGTSFIVFIPGDAAEKV